VRVHMSRSLHHGSIVKLVFVSPAFGRRDPHIVGR
jgi:hypothetical protein